MVQTIIERPGEESEDVSHAGTVAMSKAPTHNVAGTVTSKHSFSSKAVQRIRNARLLACD